MSDFWSTDEGIRLRTKMLAQYIVTRTWLATLKARGQEVGVDSLVFRSMPTACEYCLPYDGKVYKMNQYVKYIPVHPWCECGYEPHLGPEWMGDYVLPLLVPIGVN